MTNREAQIFQWISENPMISQEELAQRAGITRSSVAVHISNLMKKGYLRGKGYLLGDPNYFVVLGAANMDIGGYPDTALIDRDSNPGSVSMSFGGVGRNIAHNIRLLGLPVKFISAFGDDPYATRLIEHLTGIGVDLTASLRTKDAQTSSYLFIADSAGDMQLAVSDMRIYEYLTPEFMADKLELINRSRALFLDTNIPESTLHFVAENCTVPIIADPVSCKKAVRLLPILHKLHTVCPNRLEAEVLSGCSITTDADWERVSELLLAKGISRVFLTLGARGVYCADKNTRCLLPPHPVHVVNATGAGDAFTASLAYSMQQGFSLEEAARFGVAASSMAIESRETIHPSLCAEAVRKRSGL